MRIFIDCSFIDFSRQPTGIPRVVTKYIEGSYTWADARGIEVVPVVTTAIGLIPVRPVPGRNPPAYLKQLVRTPVSSASAAASVAQHVDEVAFRFQAALSELGASPMPRECLHAARTALDRLIEQFTEADQVRPVAVEAGDVLFCPAYWHDVPPEHFKRLSDMGVKVVTLIHDILPVTHAKFYEAPWKFQFADALAKAIRQSDALYAVSGYTAASVEEFAARNGLGPIKVHVAHNGHDPLAPGELGAAIADGSYHSLVKRRVSDSLFREQQPFIMVGTLEPKKGHIPAIRAFEAMWQAGLERPLVVIGRKGWMEQPVVEAVELSPYFNEKLFWFDDFDDVDLAFAYRHARALIFSSYAEGFGIPMIEALTLGCPLVALDTLVAREVAGDAGLFFSDFAGFAGHVVRLDTDEGHGAAVRAIAGFSWPTWDELTVPLLDRLAGLPG